MSPNFTCDVGSPTTQKSILSFLPLRSSTTFTVPSTATPSSSEVIINPIEPLKSLVSFKNSSIETIKAAIDVFISAAPRP